MINRHGTVLIASAVAFGAMSVGVEAKKISYEINGQRYSYSTNNNAQTALARRRIEAANAADAAKLKAEQERAANPLAAIFGSQVQREAEEAEARLRAVLSEKIEYSAAPQRPARVRVQRSRKTTPAREARRAVAVADEPDASPPRRPPGVKSVSVDVESGIKTTFMTDGTVREEPISGGIATGPGGERPTGR